MPAIGTLLLTLAITALALMTLTGSNGTGRTFNHPTIALVNEDNGGSFDHQTYNFGKQFAHVVQDDGTYQWQMVSRAVADKAYEKGSVQGVVYLPQSFSHDILTLQDLNPTKAHIDYTVSNRQSAASRNALQVKLNNTLRDFNTRVVRMYYVSVADSVADAQANMTTVVNGQHALTDSVKNNIDTPMGSAAKAYRSASSQTTGLRDMNTSWIRQQNGFTQATTRSLNDSATALSAQLPHVTSFFDEWNASQTLLNATNLTNANGALTRQWSSDNTFYDRAFDTSTQTLLAGNEQWAGFSDSTKGNSLRTLTSAYDEAVEDTIRNMQEQTCALGASRPDCKHDDAIITKLQALERQTLHEYFEPNTAIREIQLIKDQQELTEFADTGNSQKNDDARAALAAKIKNSFNSHDDTSINAYVNNLQRSVCSTLGSSSDADIKKQADDLFKYLKGKGLEDNSISAYDTELSLLLLYRSSQGICGDAPKTNLPALIPTAGVTTDQPVHINERLSVNVPAGVSTTITIDNPSPNSIQVTAPQSLNALGCDSQCGRLRFTPANTQAPGQAAMTITNTANNDNGNPDPGDNQVTANGSAPLQLNLNYTITANDTSRENTLTFIQTNRTASTDTQQKDQQQTRSSVIIAPSGVSANETIWNDNDFKSVTQLLGNLDTNANLTRMLYAGPEEQQPNSEGKPNFNQEPSKACAANTIVTNASRFNDHSCHSIYNLYNTISDTSLNKRLNQQDVDRYQIAGASALNGIYNTLDQASAVQKGINRTITTLNSAVNDGNPGDTRSKLDDWYQQALQYITGLGDTWDNQQPGKSTTSTQLWNNQRPGNNEIYYDKTDTSDLYDTISQLIKASSQSATQTAASAQIITNNATDFNDLVNTINTTTTATNAIRSKTDKTLNQANTTLKQTNNYANNFSEVLANTRNRAADKNTIYDFLTNPLTITNHTDNHINPWQTIDWRWPLTLIIGILIGALTHWIITTINRKKHKA